MNKTFLKVGFFLGALSVVLGAFAAHALKNNITSNAYDIFETAVKYQFYHVFALIITAVLFAEYNKRFITWAGRFFILGIILFSGSLYFLTAIKAMVKPGFNWVGAITPIGGICFVLGWICLFTAVVKKS
jgi:uncharacterized membrane protein YgdD (TMEM256/DUF423 family)